MADRPVSVLIVDDSALMRNLVSRIFDSTPGFRTVGTAMNGLFALKKLDQLRPDLIVLDLEMPEMNGIEFLRERQRRGISVPVIILSSIAEKGAKITMEALSLGASDFVLKPGGAATAYEMRQTAEELIELGRVYGRKAQRTADAVIPPREKAERLEELPPAEEKAEPVHPTISRGRITPLRESGPMEVVAIGISTGGPNALRELLPNIDPDLSVPVLIVQHMPAGFTQEFAESLDKICPLEVREAREGDLIQRGRVFVAPGNAHMTVEARPLAKTVKLSDAPPVSGHRPSADVLFSSVANVYANRCLALIMTGMGRDGAMEIGSIYREGGITVAQDEASSVVFGMPRAAIEAGVIHHVLPLSRMAETINRLCRDSPLR